MSATSIAAAPPDMRGFWCDDFDGDLYSLVPRLRSVVEPLKRVRLVTYGHTSDGHLNHPSVWNSADGGFECFFGFTEPCKPAWYYVGGDAPVDCTGEELVRDVFAHTLRAYVEGAVLFDACQLSGALLHLLYAKRGHPTPWRRESDPVALITEAVTPAVRDLEKLARMLGVW